MDVLTALSVFNYGLVLLYGLILSMSIAGGWEKRGKTRMVPVLYLLLLLVQSICWLAWGVEVTRQLYPLVVHLPLVLILVGVLKKPWGVSVVSVCTAYLCCQLPRWVSLIATAVTDAPLVGEVCYTLSVFPFLLLLLRSFSRAAHDAITYSTPVLLLFGSLPVAYYLFDYATAVYSDVLYIEGSAMHEFLPTALIVFYVLFLTTYHAQEQKRAQAELQRSMLEAELEQTGTEMENLRRMETQTAIYQHDMRHHLAVIEGFLSSNRPQQAEEYVRRVRSDVETVTPKRFCENETVNLLCSAFADRAERLGVRLKIEVKLPKKISVSDTELCSVLSNGLENALHAVRELEAPLKWTELYCEVRLNKLLVEIKNPYIREIVMREDMPVSSRKNHGYGCRSIRAIAEHYRGLCTFEPQDGIFTLRVVLPINEEELC